MEKKIQKQKKNKTEVERLLNKAFDWAGVGKYSNIYAEFGFDDFAYDHHDNITYDEVKSVNKKINEAAVAKAIKNHPDFKKSINRLILDLTHNFIDSVKTSEKYMAEDIIRDKKQQAFEAKNAAIKAAAEKASIEKRKKMQAQKNIFNEGLSSSQKKALKALYNLDISK